MNAPSLTTAVTGPAGPIEVHEEGAGHPVVMLPSLGRGAADFDDLAGAVAAAGHRAIRPEDFAGNLVRQLARMQLEALRRPADPRVVAQQWFYFCQCVAQSVTGHGNKDVAHAIETAGELRVGTQVRRKADARKVAFVLAVRNHSLEKIKLDDTAEPDVTTGSRELQCQRGSPRTGADDSYRFWCRVDDLVCLSGGSLFSLLLLGLHVQRIEIDWLQNEFGEPALLDHRRDAFACIREEDVRAETTDDRRQLFPFVTGNLEQAGLL